MGGGKQRWLGRMEGRVWCQAITFKTANYFDEQGYDMMLGCAYERVCFAYMRIASLGNLILRSCESF